jgi:ribosomal protein S20
VFCDDQISREKRVGNSIEERKAMTRALIKEALEWNTTDIDNAKDAMANAKRNLDKAKACRGELLAMLKAPRRKPNRSISKAVVNIDNGFLPRHGKGFSIL